MTIRRGLTCGLLLVLTCAIFALPAIADPIAGATYNGKGSDGASVTFTVSPDGTIVDSYRVTSNGGSCSFVSDGDPSGWAGAPITGNAFSFEFNYFQMQGTFPGAQTAAGTFRVLPQAGCDSGTVSWMATTTATPRPTPGGGSGSPGGGTKGSGTGSKPTVRRFTTRLGLHKLSSKKLGGRITSSAKACRVRRTVILWRGSKRIASTRSKADGSFSFARSAAVRGHRVRASAPAMKMAAGMCEAGSSTFIGA